MQPVEIAARWRHNNSISRVNRACAQGHTFHSPVRTKDEVLGFFAWGSREVVPWRLKAFIMCVSFCFSA
jgi:hypothetical protein